MIKKLSILLGLVLTGSVTQASYLYFQVNAADAEDFEFQGARVVAFNAGGYTYLDIADWDGTTMEGVNVVGEGVSEMAINLSQLTDATAYSFYIELVNWNGSSGQFDVVAVSDGAQTKGVTYATLVQSGFIDDGEMGLPITSPAQVWHGGSYSVPEPSCALLVMMGVGLLALKRKKV